jgi:hypothetical protein
MYCGVVAYDRVSIWGWGRRCGGGCISWDLIPCIGKVSRRWELSSPWLSSKLGMGRGGDGCRGSSSRIDCIGLVSDCILPSSDPSPRSGDVASFRGSGLGFFALEWRWRSVRSFCFSDRLDDFDTGFSGLSRSSAVSSSPRGFSDPGEYSRGLEAECLLLSRYEGLRSLRLRFGGYSSRG